MRGALRIVHADEGTENCNVAGIQCFFRRNGIDSFAGDASFNLCMDVHFPIKGLKLGGLFYVKQGYSGRGHILRQ